LNATAGNAKVSLTWAASSGAASYNIYRGTTASGESATPYKTGVTTTTYSDTNVTNGITYYYEATAVNSNSSVESPKSNETSATPLATPTILTATAASYSEIDLTWNGVAGATGYGVYRSLDNVNFSGVGASNGATYADTKLSPNTTYYYYVEAIGVNSISSPSNTANATTLIAPPTNLTATAGNTQVSLTWTAASGATSYNIYRGTTSGGEATTAIKTGVTSTSPTTTK
jgi:cellulose 1,4-beta-cellobiosidase